MTRPHGRLGAVVAGAVRPVKTHFGDLVGGQAEDEQVVGADLISDFDVGPVQRSHRQGAVQGKLHVAGARRLLARRGNLLAEVGRRDDLLGHGHPVIGDEDQADAGPRVRASPLMTSATLLMSLMICLAAK